MKTKKLPVSRDTPFAWLMLAPNIVLFIIFMLYPILQTFVISLTRYDLITPMRFIGIENYLAIFKDEVALECLKNTIVFTLITVPVSIVLSLFLAVALNANTGGKKIFRAVFFIPSITSSVAVAVVWQWLYNPEFGLINYLLSFFAVPPVQWLTTSKLALLSICIVSIWRQAGYNMIIYLAGLQGISTSYYEAADLDGAEPWQKLTSITIPLLTPTTFFVFVTSIIGAFQTFDLVNLMTKGGPGRSSSLLAHYLYQNAFNYLKMGYAAALAYLLFFMVLVITLINMRFEKRVRSIY